MVINEKEEIEEEVSNELHFENYAELSALRQELSELLRLSDALGGLIAPNNEFRREGKCQRLVN